MSRQAEPSYCHFLKPDTTLRRDVSVACTAGTGRTPFGPTSEPSGVEGVACPNLVRVENGQLKACRTVRLCPSSQPDFYASTGLQSTRTSHEDLSATPTSIPGR